MPRKPGKVVKGRNLWVRGSTIENLLTKEFGVLDAVEKSEEISDSELGQIIDRILRQYILEGGFTAPPQSTPDEVNQPQNPKPPKAAEMKRALDTTVSEDDFDF